MTDDKVQTDEQYPVWPTVADYGIDLQGAQTIEEQIIEAYTDFLTRFGRKPTHANINIRAMGEFQTTLEQRLGVRCTRIVSVSQVAPRNVQFYIRE